MTMPQIAGPLAAALDVVAEGCADLADPWWVFGSAGMALVGVPGLTPPDVDLIVSERDARRLLDRWNTAPHAAAASPLFRSAIFAKAQVACPADRDHGRLRSVFRRRLGAGGPSHASGARLEGPAPVHPERGRTGRDLPPLRPAQGSGAGRPA